jgi:hypothetical protein
MALRSDGSGDFANRTTGGFYTPTVFTVCFWAKREANFDGGSTWWALGGPTESPENYITFYNENSDGHTFMWEQFGGDQVGTIDMVQDTWYFIALSRSGTGASQTTAYNRTASAASLTSAIATFTNGDGVTREHVFANPYNTALAARGSIAAMKQWTAALTAAELLAESHSLAPLRFANLHSWRPMGDSSVAGNMVDYSGNGRSLTANGSMLAADGPPVGWRQGRRKIFIPVAGGTTFNITPSGSVSPAGALTKQAQKVLSGAISPTGALRKALARLLSGSITPAGLLLKQPQKPLSGAVTPTGAIIRQPRKGLSGSSTPTGAIAKAITRALSGSVTPAGALSTVKVIIRAFVGSVTATGTLIKQTGKGLSGTVTPSGLLQKLIPRAFSGSITPTGTLSALKVVFRSFSGSITATGALSRLVSKGLGGSVTPSGALRKLVSKLFSGIVTLSGVVVNFVAGAVAPKVTVAVSNEPLTRVSASNEPATIVTVSNETGG